MLTFKEYIQLVKEDLQGLVDAPTTSQKIYRTTHRLNTNYYIDAQPRNSMDVSLGDVYRIPRIPKLSKKQDAFEKEFKKDFGIATRSIVYNRSLFHVIADNQKTRTEIMHAFKGRNDKNQQAHNNVSNECITILADEIVKLAKRLQASNKKVQIWFPESSSDFNKRVAALIRPHVGSTPVQELQKQSIVDIGAKNLFQAGEESAEQGFLRYCENLYDAYFTHTELSTSVLQQMKLSREKIASELIHFYNKRVSKGEIYVENPYKVDNLDAIFKDRYVKNRLIKAMQKYTKLFVAPPDTIREGVCILYDDNISGGFTEANARHALSIPMQPPRFPKLTFYSFYGVNVIA